MKKSYLLLGLFFTAMLAIITFTPVKSNYTFPPAGNSGEPGSPVLGKTCAQSGCHPQPAVDATSSNLTLQIGTSTPTTTLDNNFKYVPGTVYNIALLINTTTTGNPYYGFQMVAEDASNAQAGSFTATNTNTTLVVTSPPTGTRQYIGHKGANTNHNWVFKWTAPAGSTGAVTFYYAANVANASSTPPTISEGTIYKGAVTIQPSSVGINDISDKVSDLNIFPNPFTSQFGLSFNLKETTTVSAQLYSLNGQLVSELMNEQLSEGVCNKTFDINSAPEGIYLMKLNVGELSVTRKIVKQ